LNPALLNLWREKNRILRCSLKRGRLQGRKKIHEIEPVCFVAFSVKEPKLFISYPVPVQTLVKYRFRIQALFCSYSNKNFCTKSLSQSCHRNRIQKIFQFRFRHGISSGSDRIRFHNTELALKHFLTQLTRLFFKTNADILAFSSQNNIEKKTRELCFWP
jgi:hypothetical protein